MHTYDMKIIVFLFLLASTIIQQLATSKQYSSRDEIDQQLSSTQYLDVACWPPQLCGQCLRDLFKAKLCNFLSNLYAFNEFFKEQVIISLKFSSEVVCLLTTTTIVFYCCTHVIPSWVAYRNFFKWATPNFFFSNFVFLSVNSCSLKHLLRLDSNMGPLVSGATALPTDHFS